MILPPDTTEADLRKMPRAEALNLLREHYTEPEAAEYVLDQILGTGPSDSPPVL